MSRIFPRPRTRNNLFRDAGRDERPIYTFQYSKLPDAFGRCNRKTGTRRQRVTVLPIARQKTVAVDRISVLPLHRFTRRFIDHRNGQTEREMLNDLVET
jgi:hypothetical protein